MAINNTHPEYDNMLQEWIFMRDSYEGESAIKKKGTAYLPATLGMIKDGLGQANSKGTERYEAYKTRAIYPEYISDAIETYVGMMHQKEPTITLPNSLSTMEKNATLENESIRNLIRRINIEQLITGRFGLLLDIDTKGNFYIVLYKAEDLINWDTSENIVNQSSLNFVNVDESGYTRKDDFTWEEVDRYRILILGNSKENESEGVYQIATYNDKENVFQETDLRVLKYKGASLNKIPFVIGNSKDVISDVDTPPLVSLARLSLAIYRGEADYRQNLHQQGQDTLVVIGGNMGEVGPDGNPKPVRVGTGSLIEVDLEGDAKFIGTNSNGLPEQRKALENDKEIAETKAGQVIKPGLQVESGESLRRRIGAQTATLIQIAQTSASAVEELLKIAAEWSGQNPDEVSIEPNIDFNQNPLATLDLVQMARAKKEGLPISYKTMHDYIRKNELTELDFQEELKLILGEAEYYKFLNPAEENKNSQQENENSSDNVEDE